MSLMVLIDRCIQVENISPTRIGREAVNDPRLVFDIRNGRCLRPETRSRLLSYLAGKGISV